MKDLEGCIRTLKGAYKDLDGCISRQLKEQSVHKDLEGQLRGPLKALGPFLQALGALGAFGGALKAV